MIEQPVKMFMDWDDERSMFSMSFKEGDTLLFQAKMTPQSFEALTNDMIKAIKNYNLYELEKYKVENDKKNSVVDPETNCCGVERSSEQSENSDSEKTCGVIEVI